MTPVILLVSIYTGVVTATEAGALAGLYAVIIGAFGYKLIGWKKLYQCILDTLATACTVGLCCGLASGINFIMAKEKIAVSLANLAISIGTNKYTFLFVIDIIVLILGMFMDTNVIQLDFIPMIVPLAKNLGIDLVHLGVIMCYNMMIGLATPPYGGLLFITSAISGTPLKEVVKEIWIPVLVMIVLLFILTYFPDIILFLPRTLMGYGG